LTPEEQSPQDLVERQWSEAIRQALRANPHDEDVPASMILPKEILKYILRARLGAVHLACMDAGYSEAGDTDMGSDDFMELEGASANVNDLLITMSTQKRRSLKQKREAFMTTMEGGKWNSSRIRETLEIVQEHLLRYAGKIVIFSEFLCTLDVLAVALHESGLEVLRFDGTVDSKDRETVVQKFEEDHDEARVLLVTSRSGGLGRSFTPADRVIHLTPCWNPALAEQATDCVIRLPQKRVVHVDYMYAPTSIEARVLELQTIKQGKARNLLDPDDDVCAMIEQVRLWRREDFMDLVRVIAPYLCLHVH
jgi:SNF2 family DNA or RNA helicase